MPRLSDPLQLLVSTGLEHVRWNPALPFVDWAEENMRMPDGGPFRWFPYQRSIARDMFEPGVAILALRIFSGFGKTFALGAGMAYAVKEHAARCGIRFPNDDDGKEWLAEELKPVIGYEQEFEGKGRFFVQGVRATRDVANLVRFANGGRVQVYGTSPGKTRRAQLDISMVEEIDAMPDVAGEGDPVAGFFGRTRGRRLQRRWAASYPSILGESRIDDLVASCQSLWWLFECLNCNELWLPLREHVGMETDKSGDVEKAWIECPKCRERFDDRERREMSEKSSWWVRNSSFEDGKHGISPEIGAEESKFVPDSEENRRAYRAYSSGCMVFLGRHDDNFPDYIHEIAAKTNALKSSRNPQQSERVLVNQLDARSWADESERKPDVVGAYSRREPYDPVNGEIPAGVLVICAGVDVNKGFLAAEIVGFGLNGEEWGLGYHEIHGNEEHGSTWNELEQSIIEARFRHPIEGSIPVSMTCVDSKYKSKVVKTWAAARREKGVVPIAGSTNLSTPFLGHEKTDPETGVKFRSLGTHFGKDEIYQRLELQKDPEATVFPYGYMHCPAIDLYGRRYFEELTAETGKMKRAEDGKFYRFFELPAGKLRNEPLDVRTYAKAACRILNPDFEAIARRHAQTTEKQEKGEKPRQKPTPEMLARKLARRRRRGGGFRV